MIKCTPIGIIHSPCKERPGTPRQACGRSDLDGTIEIYPDFSEGLKDLEGFSHIVVLFYMHLMEKTDLTAFPPWDDQPHGVFSTCSPFRPNHMGISVVKLNKIEDSSIHFNNVDMVDGSPVIDIKPYVPDLFPQDNIKIGWMEDNVTGMTDSKTGDKS